ncbi:MULTISPECIES: hypothetical protein [unclassified Guyparkeria]|uniref:hypothetical protein n=1 Tax=unclassified Guyparkeria TaxID=2626246 RepID=UPI0007333C2E|nr:MULTISPECIES: hypothetical protein [unclassified Guyparkeria]KTG17736.1 hypothetical protein AUR63_06310 [Guyparkeria sp. XI15]OAE89447.1 hypothetical protein AWR35_06320 [Guyparkeria sp. WRN-7]
MKHPFNVFEKEPIDPGFPTRVLVVGGVAVGVACGLLLFSSAVAAANPAIVSLSDPELAKMRGRFVTGDSRVMYFGVEMVSHWKTTGGAMTAGLTVGIDRSQQLPQVTFEPTVAIEGEPTINQSGEHHVAGGSEVDSHGVRQQIQVAGNDNRATNAFEVHVDPQSRGQSGGEGGYRVEISQNGAVVASGLTGSGQQAGVSMRLGNSQVFQGFQAGAASQLIQLAGNHQVVNNQLRLMVGIDPTAMNDRERLQRQVGQALASLRGGI